MIPEPIGSRAVVLCFIVESPSGTTEPELTRDLRLPPDTTHRHCGDLEEAGYLVDTGQVRWDGNGASRVWFATPRALAWYDPSRGVAA